MSKKELNSYENIYLDSLENLFSNVPSWLATVYDEELGGFYHNALMVNDSLFGPDLQSTSFALTILSGGNIISMDSLSESFKTKMLNYVSSVFDDETALYIDPVYKEQLLKSERNLARTQNMANSVFSKLGVSPGGIDIEKSTPPYLSTFDQFETWFYQQKWDRVWTAFDRLVSNTSFIKRLPAERADSIVNFIQIYAKKNQDPDGLWGMGQAQEVRFSGAAKYGTFCKNMNLKMPNADKMYATILDWFKTSIESNFSEHSPCPICVPRNALKVLYYVKPHLSFEIPENDKNLLVLKTFEMLKFYSNPDGGFMKHHNESKIAPLDLNLGEYLVLVSDMNGTQLAVTARASLYDLIDLDVPLLNSKNKLKFAKN